MGSRRLPLLSAAAVLAAVAVCTPGRPPAVELVSLRCGFDVDPV